MDETRLIATFEKGNPMDRKLLFAALLLMAATVGCCACSHCNDYGSPVIDGPYATQGGRSGSTLSGGVVPGAIHNGSMSNSATPTVAP